MEAPAPEVTVVETVEEKLEEKRERHRAVVTRIGTEPLLAIEGLGEFRFAYRNVKKKPGETRPYLNVGDEVECRLTKAAVPKAVSVRVVKKTQPLNTYVHNPYEVPEMVMSVPVPITMVPHQDEASLFDFLGGADGISAMVDSALDIDSACKSVDKFVTDFEAEEEDSFYPVKGNVADDMVGCYSCYDDVTLRQRSHSAPPVY